MDPSTDIPSHGGPPTEHQKDDKPDPEPVQLVRSSEFWFEDGNIVLQAEHTQFRLHRSILSMHSPIFRDMFACPQPENRPIVDGCPVIHLPETLEDVQNFIKILYKSIETYNRSEIVSISLLRTMLHFGKKYEMRRLRQQAVYCFVLEFPPTLRKWTDQYPGEVIQDNPDMPLPSVFELLYLAHNHSITYTLSAIYLRICLNYDAEEITNGFRQLLDVTTNSVLTNKLLTNCLIGREHLHRSVSSRTLAWLHDNNAFPSSDCTTAQKCQTKRSTLITELWNNDIQFSLKFAVQPWDKLNLGKGLCSSCLKTAKAAYLKGRIANWDLLETFFGIDDLEEEELDSDYSSQG